MGKKDNTTKINPYRKPEQSKLSKILSNKSTYVIALIVVAIIVAIVVMWGTKEKPESIENEVVKTESVETVTNSFVGTVIEETTTHMLVEPLNDKPDVAMGGMVKVVYNEAHLDYSYGVGRKVVVYFEGDPIDEGDGIKTVTTDDISTEGFREFELEVEPSGKKRKQKIISSEEMQNITNFGYMRYANVYYYGADDVKVTIKGWTMPLKTAIEQGRITLFGLLEKAEQDMADGVIEGQSYDDGGSVEYKYPGYTIISYRTLDGNTDFYIGVPEMDIKVVE